MLTRELAHDPKLIVALYPTRGLDARSAAGVARACSPARAAGAAVLLVSEDLDELFAISDRLIVLRDGRIAGTFLPRILPRRDDRSVAWWGRPMPRDLAANA